MVTLNSILKSLIELRNHPFVDEQTYADAASYAKEAGELAMLSGIQPERVSEMITPIAAIALVTRYIAALPPQEWLSVPDAATLLGVSQSKIAEWVKGDRLEAVNVAGKGKRACYRIHRLALSKLKPENKPVRRYKPPREII